MTTPKEKAQARQRRYAEKNRGKILLMHRERRRNASPESKQKDREAGRRWFLANPEKRRAGRLRNYVNRMFCNARHRAGKDGIPFEIEESDIRIPEFCPVDGGPIIPLSGGARSPSLDRIVASLGYVPGNIVVISQSANSTKGNRSLSEMQEYLIGIEARVESAKRVIAYMKAHHDGAQNDGLEVR